VHLQVTLSKKMVDIASGPVEAAEAAVSVATTAAATQYAEISKAIAVSSCRILVPFLKHDPLLTSKVS
jgi:hypothetical protein